MEYSKKQVDYHKTVLGASKGYGPPVMGAQTGVGYNNPHPAVMGAATNPNPYVGGAMSGPGCAGPGCGVNPIMPTNVAPAEISPTQNTVNENVFKTIVPHVHPTHNTTVNKHVFQHQHYFPHSNSVVNECFNQQLVCGGPPPIMPVNPCCGPPMPPFNPCCGPRPRRFGF